MKILIAGASGTLGARRAHRLLSGGHDVWGTTRGRIDVLASAGVRPVVADLLDPAATREAVASVAPEAIVQVLNALPPAGPSKASDLLATNRIRADGTRNLVAAAEASGVGRYVAESFVLGYGSRPPGSPPLDESAPLARGLPDGMQDAVDALAGLEQRVLGFGGIVLRFGVFYGHGVPSNDALAAAVRKRGVPVFGFPGVMPFVHIDDAAEAVAIALGSAQRGEIYNIAGTHATFGEYVTALAAATGAPSPRRLPRFAARLGGAYRASMLKANLRVATNKAFTGLGWRPSHPTLREGLAMPARR
ncbi:MAG TPA: NAD(P)-dependent oxidoreductase [Actinomycetota bacterium]|nr:NAD(P)-dependent oxidoreductase [Actinomycetota bacterium]